MNGSTLVADEEQLQLTKQEIQLLQLLANGATSREAARALDVDLSEIMARWTTIMEKVRANYLPPKPP